MLIIDRKTDQDDNQFTARVLALHTWVHLFLETTFTINI